MNVCGLEREIILTIFNSGRNLRRAQMPIPSKPAVPHTKYVKGSGVVATPLVTDKTR